jgi:hypothetical protein
MFNKMKPLFMPLLCVFICHCVYAQDESGGYYEVTPKQDIPVPESLPASTPTATPTPDPIPDPSSTPTSQVQENNDNTTGGDSNGDENGSDESRGADNMHFYISKKVKNNCIVFHKVSGSTRIGLQNKSKNCQAISVKWSDNAKPVVYHIPARKTMIVKRRSSKISIINEQECK